MVKLDSVTRALQEQKIAGAALDVFEQEPLPADHPLWGMDNVILTPHTAGISAHEEDRRLDVLAANLRRFVAGEPLHNVVDKAGGHQPPTRLRRPRRIVSASSSWGQTEMCSR